MAGVSSPILRKLLRFGTGSGIVIGEHDLQVCLARVRPGGARIAATLRIEAFRTRPAGEWGAEYSAFLKANSAAHVAALAVLPRREVIVRQVRLPGVTDADCASAIRFQLETLHPFSEDEVVFDYQRAGRSDAFTVAIAERRHIDFYTALFAEAGIQLAGITFSGGAVFTSSRLYIAPPSEGVLAVAGLNSREWDEQARGPVEIYGESPSHPLFSAEFDMPLERAVAMAASELRAGVEATAADLGELLPAWESAPGAFDSSGAGRSRAALPWAAALAGACPSLGQPVNLLAPELRTVSSRAAFIPSIVLGVILALLASAWLVRDAALDRRYTEQLNAEIHRLEPVARQMESLDKQIAASSLCIEQLEGYRRHTKAHLDVLLEVTQMLPPPAWITTLQIDPKFVTIGGEVEQADGLVKKLDASPHFTSSEFTMPLARTGSGEMFRIRAAREGGPK
ncbi:MAG: hypothetical protein HY858_03390 [Candidatus Solibacter usitatus]|nr:hypothetical protein [Candidatus Solibacter usitatus]